MPVVVACMRGSEKSQVVNPFSSNKVRLDILDVIPAETVAAMRTDALAQHVREQIQNHLHPAEQEAD